MRYDSLPTVSSPWDEQGILDQRGLDWPLPMDTAPSCPLPTSLGTKMVQDWENYLDNGRETLIQHKTYIWALIDQSNIIVSKRYMEICDFEIFQKGNGLVLKNVSFLIILIFLVTKVTEKFVQHMKHVQPIDFISSNSNMFLIGRNVQLKQR